jgi:septal ring factor EnvC (AmiA/AmiB activator)
MKTIKDIDKEIDGKRRSLKQALDTSDMATARRIRSEMEHLRLCRNYLETNPRKDYLEQQIEDTEKRLHILEDRFSSWRAGKIGSIAELMAKYRTEAGIPTIRKQLNTLKFLVE